MTDFQTRSTSASRAQKLLWMVSVSALAAGLCAAPAFAQDQPTNASPGPAPVTSQADADVNDEIVVTGIRASLERSIEIKRNSTGIVDAISAEDIGKFPDTNLAESLQRITGVSINRRNGEGAQVTVRGFGPQYNLVTLNGRQLAASDQSSVGGDENTDFNRNTSRSFDFSNLASEGVRTLEVYKTGRAAIPTGGIGATINVVTRRPLDSRDSGLNGSIGAKANYDTNVDDCVHCGSKVTPEVSGLLSWSNPDQTFGATVFGSYQERHFTSINATVNDWNITPYSQFIASGAGNINASTQINNAPSDPNQLVARPNDARYHFSEDSRERINGQAVVQFKPSDTLIFTADALYARTIAKERRSDQSNWFNRPFDVVTFDTGHDVATPVYLHENISGETKDAGFEQQYRAQKNVLQDYGLNAKWDAADNFQINFDGHIGKSNSTPDNPNGMSSTLVAISSPTLASHSWDYDGGFPVQTVVFADPATPSATHPVIKGNGNGVLDVGDLGSQVGRQVATNLRQNIKEARIDAGWDLGSGSRFDFGGDYRDTKTRSVQTSYYQTLGDWGNAAPRDIEAIAPGVVDPFCLVCRFSHHDPMASGDGLAAFRTEDPTQLYNLLSTYYTGIGHTNSVNGFTDDTVKEKIWAAYAQLTWKGEIAGHDANLVAGVRYERTTVHSLASVVTPADIRWQSDNDFTTDLDFSTLQDFDGKGKYNNLLPSMDFQINLMDNLIGRFSFSRTISRPDYGNLRVSTTPGAPNDATAVGGVAGGNTGNPNLEPLISDNFDVSLEYYFKPGSYVSAGFFEKRVHNFIGNSVVPQNLFGLRDPSSGAPGSRSGTAKAQLPGLGADISDVNLFTYTALLQQNGGSTAAADAIFLANSSVQPGSTTRTLNQAFVDSTLAAIDLYGDANDPLFNFNVNTPINNKDAKIWGFEVAGTYFLGDTGIGIAAAYTYVRGNIGIDVTSDPTANQFALIGLSDTANVTLIYDKYGISARLAYNWRDKFLSEINRGGSHNPVFTAPYGQLDFNVSYDITPHLAVSLEGINLLEEGVKTYARSKNEIYFDQEGEARYLLGVRYRF